MDVKKYFEMVKLGRTRQSYYNVLLKIIEDTKSDPTLKEINDYALRELSYVQEDS